MYFSVYINAYISQVRGDFLSVPFAERGAYVHMPVTHHNTDTHQYGTSGHSENASL